MSQFLIRSYDPQAVKSLMMREKGNVFVDVGAGRGCYSLALSRNFKKIYAFEPRPENVYEIVKTAFNHGIENIQVFPLAVSSHAGIESLYLNAVEKWSRGSLLKRDAARSLLVATATLRDFFHNDPIDLVKIDVEGTEEDIIDSHLNVKKYIIEVHKPSSFEGLTKKLAGKYEIQPIRVGAWEFLIASQLP